MPASGPSSGLTVLVVDDNSDCAESTAILLRSYGHTAEVANDAATALAAVERSRPDVVLLDIALPGMSGWELARRIQEGPGEPKPLLIAVTGLAREEDRQQSAASGIDLHLAKPVDPAQLQALLKSVESARS
jgi:CheY-like chemotaxis protein